MPNKTLALFDIGANLTSSQFSSDCCDVIERARHNNVVAQLITGTNLKSSQAALDLANTQPFLFSTCGFHPHHASEFTADSINALLSIAQSPKVRAIGETGLDFNRMFSPQQQQEWAFNEHLQLAAELKKPLFLHQRDAHSIFISLLSNQRASLNKIVVHCFTDSLEALKDYLNLDCYIGITGWIADKKRGETLRQIVKYIPNNRLLIETDAPYLLPHNLNDAMGIDPTIKRRNEPAYLYAVLAKIAECRNQPIEHLAATTFENTLGFLELDSNLTPLSV